MKLCDYCETALPDDASACAQCGMVLPEAEDVTIKSLPIATALVDAAIKGRPVPNPETPVPDVTIVDTLLTLDDDDITRRDSAPTMPDDAIISGDSAPTLEAELSDAAIVFAYASPPIIATDPNLSAATIDTLVADIDRQDDPMPVNGHYAEPLEVSETLPVMSFAEADEETAPQNGYDIPAPLYPDYGKANAAAPASLYANLTNETDNAAIALEDAHTVPTPLYENYKKTASQANAAGPLRLLPRKISIAYPLLWSRRSLIAIALCLLLILGSIGVLIFTRSQPGSGPPPVIHTTAAKLQAITSSLNSQSVQGHKVILAAEIANAGGQILHWTADTGHTAWLSIDKQSGIIPAGAPQQTIFTTADARQLTVGNYTGALQLHSNGGEANILVSLMVVPPTNQKQATMTVDPPSLTFGTLQQGQQATNIVTISNAGTGTLNWHAGADSNSGITLTPPSGTILAGGYPQELAVTINTATLTQGLTTAHINFTSNASNTPPPVGVSVNVTPANGSALTISASPGSFTNGCLICTVILTASQGGQGMQPSVQWSTSGVGLPGIAFSPASGTLLAGQSMPVQVTVPNTSCPASANFTFVGAANTVPVLWSCTPLPTPTPILTASPTSLSNCYTCTVSISPAVGSLSNLVWTSSSSGINGITFTPSGGTVTPGNTQKVTVNVPQPQNCPTSANFTFSGQGAGNSVTVAWNCTAPAPQNPLLSVSPNTLNSSQCSRNNDGTYNCMVTLSESPAGNIGWSTYTNVGGTFSPPSGQLGNGQTQVQVTMNNMLCQPGSFGFQGPYNSAPVQWNCVTPIPTLSVNTSSLNQNSSLCSSDGNGGYNCYVTLGENPAGTLNWQESDNLGVSVSQQSGTLTPGNPSTQITLFSIPCQPTGTNDTFNFSSTGSNSVSVNWSCTPPPTVTTPAVTIPAAPSNIAATATSSSTILVTWNDNSNNEDGFTLSNGVTSVNLAANTTSYTWGGLTAGSYMCAHVLAYNTAGSSAWTPYACATTPSIPAAPSNIAATATSTSNILVTWNDNSNNEDGFTVSNGVTSVNVAANTTSYSWGGLSAGTYMCVHVLAYNSAGSSAWTPYACTTTPSIPAAPSNIAATATSTSTILVTWNDNSNNEDGFTLSNGVTSVNLAANTTSYTWGGLTASTYMCFHVLAYNSAGSSAWTPYACTTTPSIPAAPSNFHQDPNASSCSYTSGSEWTCVDTLGVNTSAIQNLTWNVSASSSDNPVQ